VDDREVLRRLKQANHFCGMSFPIIWMANCLVLLLGYWQYTFSLAIFFYVEGSVFIVLRDIWILKYRLIDDCPIWRFVLDHVVTVGAVVISLLLTDVKIIDGGMEFRLETNILIWIAAIALTVPALQTSRKIWKRYSALRKEIKAKEYLQF
jgi:hypothetical protein